MELIGEPSRPGTINLRVYDQDIYWWDLAGNRHEIATMCTRYRDNVLNFLRQRERFHADKIEIAAIAALPPDSGFEFGLFGDWQEKSPLFRALMARPVTRREKLIDDARNLVDVTRWQLKKRGLL